MVRNVRRKLLRFLLDAEENGKVVVGYGAPAKAVTLLSYCGVGADLLHFTVIGAPTSRAGCCRARACRFASQIG